MRAAIKAETHSDKSILSLNIFMANVTVLLERADSALVSSRTKSWKARVAQCFFIGLYGAVLQNSMSNRRRTSAPPDAPLVFASIRKGMGRLRCYRGKSPYCILISCRCFAAVPPSLPVSAALEECANSQDDSVPPSDSELEDDDGDIPQSDSDSNSKVDGRSTPATVFSDDPSNDGGTVVGTFRMLWLS
jgi:hypothetical protein